MTYRNDHDAAIARIETLTRELAAADADRVRLRAAIDLIRRGSPEPQRIVELQTIKTLVNAGVLVVCVGGGGIPVRLDSHQALHGVEAVIDKDRAAALLARELGAGYQREVVHRDDLVLIRTGAS